MKREVLLKELAKLNWYKYRSGGRHDIYAKKDGKGRITIPRHSEISEFTAKEILKRAKDME